MKLNILRHSIAAALLAVASAALFLPVNSYALQSNGVADPPMFSKLREVPSYNITFFSANGTAQLRPSVVSIPLNMTVIWLNNDWSNHTVTATFSPEDFDSKVILAKGGWYVHQFDRVGTYHYSDRLNSALQGTINVGNSSQTGYYMDMLIGGIGVLPFDTSTQTAFVVSFVPKVISLPPVGRLTYNVTVSNSTSLLCWHTFVTDSGILDLELVPFNASASGNATRPIVSPFTTWGPDFSGHHFHTASGTYHLQGPLMVKKIPYYLTVRILSQGDLIYRQPVLADKFTLHSISDSDTSNVSVSSGFDGNSTTPSVIFLPPQVTAR